MGIVEIIFWISISLIIYSTIIYLILLNLFRNNDYVVDEDYLPTITLIICAYNEEKNILNKFKNVEDLEYPMEKIQVILADDGSDDRTVEIAKSFLNKPEVSLINAILDKIYKNEKTKD